MKIIFEWQYRGTVFRENFEGIFFLVSLPDAFSLNISLRKLHTVYFNTRNINKLFVNLATQVKISNKDRRKIIRYTVYDLFDDQPSVRRIPIMLLDQVEIGTSGNWHIY